MLRYIHMCSQLSWYCNMCSYLILIVTALSHLFTIVTSMLRLFTCPHWGKCRRRWRTPPCWAWSSGHQSHPQHPPWQQLLSAPSSSDQTLWWSSEWCPSWSSCNEILQIKNWEYSWLYFLFYSCITQLNTPKTLSFSEVTQNLQDWGMNSEVDWK